jgi:AcrR family transcriptional regulator
MTTPLRERRKQLLQEEILGAARALLSEKGYVAMSMDDLAAQVGISKPTLYSHFPTKDDIVVKTAVREMERFIALIESDVDGQSPFQRLMIVMAKFVKLHAEKDRMEPQSWTPELFQLLCSREEALSCLRRIDAAISALIQAGITAGEIDPYLDPPTTASAFFALASSLRHARFTRAGEPHPDAGKMLMSIFERGVRKRAE